MALAVILHRVEDYDAWRKVYDSLKPVQASGGVMAESVHRMVGDPDNVLVTHEFGTPDQAHAFFSNPELLEGMKNGGVKGEPRVEFFD